MPVLAPDAGTLSCSATSEVDAPSQAVAEPVTCAPNRHQDSRNGCDSCLRCSVESESQFHTGQVGIAPLRREP